VKKTDERMIIIAKRDEIAYGENCSVRPAHRTLVSGLTTVHIIDDIYIEYFFTLYKYKCTTL